MFAIPEGCKSSVVDLEAGKKRLDVLWSFPMEEMRLGAVIKAANSLGVQGYLISASPHQRH